MMIRKFRQRKRQHRTRTQPGSHPPAIYVSLWNTWQTKSDESDPGVDWDQVVANVESKPSIARYSDDERRGMLLLHFACALYAPLGVIETIIEAYPEAVWCASLSQGLIPLHVACGRNAPLEVLRFLLRQAPSSSSIQDESGNTALHWACRESVSQHVVKILLTADPSLAKISIQQTFGSAYNANPTPMDIILASSRGISDNGNSASHQQWDDNKWDKLTYLLRAAHYGTIKARNGQTLSVLHAALALLMPQDVIDICVERHGAYTAGVRDVHGNLPLHYAVATDQYKGTIVKLLQLFPQAASCTDAHGRLPLHVALQHGISWQGGIRHLLKAHPAAVTMAESETSLFPAFLAASRCNVETIYCLLREYPQIVVSTADL